MPNTIKCDHCGADLPAKTLEFGGREVQIGYEFCHCPGATAERVARMEEERLREIAREAEELDRKCTAAGIPKRYMHAEHERAEDIAGAVLDGQGFYIYGNQGTYKTTLAMAAARVLVARGAVVRVCVVPNLMEAMRSRTAEDRAVTERLSTCGVLILDDLGKESPTAYACERLFSIINDRYNAMLPVIVTSNYSRGEIARRLSEGDVGPSIASRLVETTRIVHLDGADRRLHRGQD